MSIHAEPPPSVVTEPHGISYATGQQLGKGGFAICHKAERLDAGKPTGHLVALKIVKSKMDPPKLAQKVRMCELSSRDSTTDIAQVYHRITNPLKIITSKHCRFPQSILILREHLRRSGTMFVWVFSRLAEEEKMLDHAGNSTTDDPGLRRRQVSAYEKHRTS